MTCFARSDMLSQAKCLPAAAVHGVGVAAKRAVGDRVVSALLAKRDRPVECFGPARRFDFAIFESGSDKPYLIRIGSDENQRNIRIDGGQGAKHQRAMVQWVAGKVREIFCVQCRFAFTKQPGRKVANCRILEAVIMASREKPVSMMITAVSFLMVPLFGFCSREKFQAFSMTSLCLRNHLGKLVDVGLERKNSGKSRIGIYLQSRK